MEFGTFDTVRIDERAGPNFGLFFSTDNEMMVAGRINVARAESTGAFDTSYWTTGHVGSGSAVHTNGELVISPGGTANSKSQITSIQRHRQMSGTTQMMICVVRLSDLGVANNIRRWGVYDDSDGYFFELNGTTFGVGSRKSGVDTVIPYSGWNGPVKSGGFWDPATDLTYMNQFNLFFGGLSMRWQINGRVAHGIGTKTLTSPLTTVLTLPFRHESINSAGQTSDARIFGRGMSFHRISPMGVAPRYVHTTAAATTVIKAGPGTFRRVVVNNPNLLTGTATFYDNTAGSGTVIAIIGNPGSAGHIEYDLEFSTGLTVVTSSANDLTIIYD
jgi:hypothetical protein